MSDAADDLVKAELIVEAAWKHYEDDAEFHARVREIVGIALIGEKKMDQPITSASVFLGAVVALYLEEQHDHTLHL